MEKFLSGVANHILEKQGYNLNGVTVILPNHRSCIYFRQALRDNTQHTIWAPEIITLRDWVMEQSDLLLTGPLEQILSLYKIYSKKGGEETLDEFIPIAQSMLNDFSDVDMDLAPAKSFFSYLEKLQSLKVYEPGEEETEYTIRYKKFWQMFRELYFDFRANAIQEKRAYEGMIYRDVAEKTDPLKPDNKPFYIIGFSYLTKSEEKIIKTLRIKSEVEIIWDTDNYYVEDECQEAGSFFSKIQSGLEN
jgi:hypothetical protein